MTPELYFLLAYALSGLAVIGVTILLCQQICMPRAAAQEREACAKVCEGLRDEAGSNSGRVWSSGCAEAIRARGNK